MHMNMHKFTHCVCVCAVEYRAELLMRQKVGYLESVNAELCEQLERCDAEAFSHQGGLQAEKAELAARMRQLQEEVSTPPFLVCCPDCFLLSLDSREVSACDDVG
jgi:hypothetical protein